MALAPGSLSMRSGQVAAVVLAGCEMSVGGLNKLMAGILQRRLGQHHPQG